MLCPSLPAAASPLQNTSGLVIMPGSLKSRNPWDPTAREHPCLAALPSALRVLFDGSTEDAPANSETRDAGLCSQVRGRASPSQGKATSRRCLSPPSQGSQRRPPLQTPAMGAEQSPRWGSGTEGRALAQLCQGRARRGPLCHMEQPSHLEPHMQVASQVDLSRAWGG